MGNILTGKYGVDENELWKYLIMPFMSGFVGYGTNWLALKMTFYPLEFWGPELVRIKDQPLGLFGWQGIIPTKAAKMAGTCTDLMTEKLINVKEVFSRLKPAEFSRVMEPGLISIMDTIINETAQQYVPSIWEFLPDTVRDECVLKALEESPQFLTSFMEDVKEHIDDIFDLKHMVVEHCVANKQLLNNIFMECGDKEFTFIEVSGFYFGFLFGLVQMTIYFFYTASWVLPAFGFVVGIATNFIALKIIFEPIEPTKICCGLCFSFQGLFLRRQDAVSEIFARVNTQQILTTENMWTAILTGPKKENFYDLLRAHTLIFTENLAGGLKPLVVAGVGADKFAKMKEEIAKRTMDELPAVIHYSYEYTTKALDMEKTICTAMKGLSSHDFEGVLHPVFEEDEAKLIVVGGVLGLGVGVVQLFLLF
mmetsp:Transcript_5077/g.10705  ORF Transcript_5077/g.10705 Transcript_5077/m.10705 type:complete len:423 (-) Transcript_5077:69-1337(-)